MTLLQGTKCTPVLALWQSVGTIELIMLVQKNVSDIRNLKIMSINTNPTFNYYQFRMPQMNSKW